MGLYDQLGHGALWQDDDLPRSKSGGALYPGMTPGQAAFAGMAAALTRAGAASPYPVGLMQALGQGSQGAVAGQGDAIKARQEWEQHAARQALLEQQTRKAQYDADLTKQAMGGMDRSLDPEQMESLGYRMAAGGHPGAATIIGQAEKLRAAQQSRQAIEGFRSQPGVLGAGVTTNTPQGRALMSNMTGNADFDQSVLAAQNEALNSNPRLAPQAVQAPRPGLFAPLTQSPTVGPSAQAFQGQIDRGGAGLAAKDYLSHFERLQSLHSSAEARQDQRDDAGALRRDLANGARNDRGENDTFRRERTLAQDYNNNPITKSFQIVRPHVASAAKYMAGNEFNSSGDRALVFQYAKTLDPMDRVGVNDVKDVGKLGNVPERISQAVVGLAEGKVLPERVRNEMFQVIRSRFNEMNEQQADLEDEYHRRAKGYMLDSSKVVRPLAERRGSQPRNIPGGSGGGWGIREKP